MRRIEFAPIARNDLVEILSWSVVRFLHDSMDLEQHYPDDFTAE